MEKTIALFGFALFLAPSILPAQYWQGDVKWIYFQHEFLPDPEEEFRQITKTSDIVLQGKNAVVLQDEYIRLWQGNVNVSVSNEFILHSDSNKVWIFEPRDSVFYLLYDFNLEIGDTLRSYCPLTIDPYTVNYSHSIVDSISVENFNGQNRKVLYVTPDYYAGDLCSFEGKIVAGIGSLRYLVPQPQLVDPPPGGYLICYEEDGAFYPSSAFNCEITSSTSDIEETAFRIFPNPTEGKIQIDDFDFLDVQLFSINGELLKRFETTTEVDLSDYPAGSYWLRLTTENSLQMTKIIKL